MKLTNLLSIASLFIFQTVVGQELTIKGKLNSTDSLRVVLADMKKPDTLWTTNGGFQFNRQACGTLLHLFFFNPKTKHTFQREFFAASGEVVMNSDTVITLSNSQLQQLYDGFNKKYNEVSKNNDRNQMIAEVKSFVTGNTNNAVGAYILCRYFYGLPDVRQLDSLANLFTPQVAQLSYPLQVLKQKIAAQLSLLPGQTAPNFTAKDIKGKSFNSANQDGKYMILDFWGTWCNPCISGLPKMKASYVKYKEKVRFVSIACHDNASRWRAAVAKFGMTWTQLIDNDKEDLAFKFYVENFPTKILIGPDRKIIQVFKGEDNTFYDKLDELMNKTP